MDHGGWECGADELPSASARPTASLEQRYLGLLGENQKLRSDLDIARSQNDALKEQLLRLKLGLLPDSNYGRNYVAPVLGTLSSAPRRSSWTWGDVAWTAFSTALGILGLIGLFVAGLLVLVQFEERRANRAARSKALGPQATGRRVVDLTLRLNVTRPEGRRRLPEVQWRRRITRNFHWFQGGKGRTDNRGSASGGEDPGPLSA